MTLRSSCKLYWWEHYVTEQTEAVIFHFLERTHAQRDMFDPFLLVSQQRPDVQVSDLPLHKKSNLEDYFNLLLKLNNLTVIASTACAVFN